MTTEQKYPLSVMRGYKPPVVRYVWYALATDDGGNETDHSGMTHGGITNMTNRAKKTIMTLKVMDLVRDKVYVITDIPEFMKQWGENYLDPEWRVPQSLRK